MTKRDEFVKYFTNMQEEHRKAPFGEMVWGDISWWIYYAIKDEYFTRNELADMFPDLLGYIRKG